MQLPDCRLYQLGLYYDMKQQEYRTSFNGVGVDIRMSRPNFERRSKDDRKVPCPLRPATVYMAFAIPPQHRTRKSPLKPRLIPYRRAPPPPMSTSSSSIYYTPASTTKIDLISFLHFIARIHRGMNGLPVPEC